MIMQRHLRDMIIRPQRKMLKNTMSYSFMPKIPLTEIPKNRPQKTFKVLMFQPLNCQNTSCNEWAMIKSEHATQNWPFWQSFRHLLAQLLPSMVTNQTLIRWKPCSVSVHTTWLGHWKWLNHNSTCVLQRF